MENNTVKKEQLTFRNPNVMEQEKILQYVTREFQKDQSFWNIVKMICIVVDAAFILGLLGVVNSYSGREKLVIFVMAVLLSTFIFFINKSSKENKIFFRRFQDGDFQVVDCKAYEADFAVKVVNGAVIYIFTEYGQYCDERFLVDYTSAKEWTESSEVAFLLMRAARGKGYHYEMFSERKLNRR